MGLDVAVHDAAPVREPRRLEDLLDDVDRVLGIERAVLLHDLLEIAAAQVLHRDVVGAVPLPAVEHLDDVGMREAGGRGRLALEARDELRVLGEPMMQQLQRDLAPELGVLGEPHVAHAARADPVDDLVAAVDHRVGPDPLHY